MNQKIKEFLKKESKPRFVSFWGKKTLVKPYLCNTIMGDGLQLIYLGTIDQRPQYWLIRIDSNTDVKADRFDIEPVIELIEDECGRFNFQDKYYDEKKDKFPLICWAGGHWGTVKKLNSL